jgi:hypothetical protein
MLRNDTDDTRHMSDEEFLAHLVRLPASEEEWLACTDPPKLMSFLLDTDTRRIPSDRKVRLFACAGCRQHWIELSKDARLRSAVELVEHYADGMITQAELVTANSVANQAYDEYHATLGYYPAVSMARLAAGIEITDQNDGVRYVSSYMAGDETGIFVAFLRDIFGNPFRPAAFSAEWRTSTAVAIAKGMYESRDFSAMPILADALQDAGCDNEDILNHCRGPGPHVRGCWVVDLILGKT